MKSERDNFSLTESEKLKRAFGAVVTARREKCGFTNQREFARIVQISNSHLRKIEAGETSPTLSTVAKIAAALDTDAADLVDEACRKSRRSNAGSALGGASQGKSEHLSAAPG